MNVTLNVEAPPLPGERGASALSSYCGAAALECPCRLLAGHYPATPHRCASEVCGAVWRGSFAAADFRVITLPYRRTLAGTLSLARHLKVVR